MLTAAAGYCELVHTAHGQVLIAQGTDADSLYVVVTGELKVFSQATPSKEIATLSSYDVTGDFGLLTGEKRGATVVACSAGELLKLSRISFDTLQNQWPNEMQIVADRILKRVRFSILQDAITRSSFLGSLEPSLIQEMCAAVTLKSFPAGAVLFRAGETSAFLCILISGRLRVITGDEQSETTVREVVAGETVGEIGVLTGDPRMATVEVARDSIVGELSRESYCELLKKHPIAIASTFSRRVVEVLRNQSAPDRIPNSSFTIAVLPIGRSEVVGSFGHNLADAFAKLGPTLHLSSSRIIDYLSERSSARICSDGAEDSSLLLWLNSMEAEYQFIVYEADPAPTAWSRRCIRQSDRVIFACDTGEPCSPGALESDVLSRSTRIERVLILLRTSGEPTGTSRWLAARQVDRHFHVRSESVSDIARAARLMAGRSCALVLGGGFARGIAHLGVIQAMQELDIPIDAVGGSSMGAIIAGLYAMGYSNEDSLRIAMQGGSLITRDFTLPVAALVSGARMREVVENMCGDRCIEDLTIPFFCVSANLSRGRSEIHTNGPLVKAALATCRVPGIFAPIVSNGDLLIDGGVINKVPVDCMRGLVPGGRVIAVDVSPADEHTDNEDYGLTISGWQALARRWSPFLHKPRVPSILTTLLRTVEFTSEAYRKRISATADLYLRPPLAKLRFNDFRKGEMAVEIAREYAINAIRESFVAAASSSSSADLRLENQVERQN